MRVMRRVRKFFCVTMILNPAMVFLTGCNVNVEVSLPIDDNALPAFSLVDVNLNSARYQELVSPRDYAGQVSAWYFGHST